MDLLTAVKKPGRVPTGESDEEAFSTSRDGTRPGYVVRA
jgi:hypothetical protein